MGNKYFSIDATPFTISADMKFVPNTKAPGEVVGSVNDALLASAKELREDVLRRFLSKWSGRTSGDVRSAIGIKATKYKDSDFKNQIVGIFDTPTGKWEDSVGARAVFFEYGRAYAGDRGGPKIQKPRPFIRPALKAFKNRMAKKFADII